MSDEAIQKWEVVWVVFNHSSGQLAEFTAEILGPILISFDDTL